MADRKAYLIIRSHAPHANFQDFREQVLDGNALVLADAGLHEVTALECGSVPAHIMVLRYENIDAAKTAWQSMPVSLIARPSLPTVLAVHAVPEEGYEDPGIPTVLNAKSTDADEPTLMLIEGSASDQTLMDQYRDIILPMLFELGAYYKVFELGGDVEVLSGNWDEAIFAISWWPNPQATQDFWLSEKYQRTAVPLRLDVGHFNVVTMGAQND